MTDLAEDPRRTMTRAADLAAHVLDVLPDDASARPTPCAEWTVRDLAGHLVAVTARVERVARGGHASDLPTLLADAPEEGFAAAFRAGVVAFGAAWADDGLLDRTVHHPAGDMPGAAAATVYVQEFATHAVDLAVALRRPDLLDEELLEGVVGIARRVVPAERAGFPFAPPVLVADDAPAHVRLAAWLGRDVGTASPVQG